MLLVLGEYHRLAQILATVHTDALFHQGFQYIVDRLLVKHPTVYLSVSNIVGHVLTRLLEVFFNDLLILVGKILVGNAFVDKARMRFNAKEGHQHMILLGRSFVFVYVSWDTTFHFKEVIGVSVYFVGGRGGKTNNKRIKIIKDCSILLENGTMRLIHDNQVKVCGRIHTRTVIIAYSIDSIQNRGIR